MTRYYVLDQNVLRRRGSVFDRLLRWESAHFVLIDTALVELVKPELWDDNLRQGLARLREIPHRCHMSIAVKEAVDIEMQTGRSAARHLMPQPFSKLLREIIRESSSPTPSADWAARVAAVRAELEEHDLNAHAAKADVGALVQFLRENMSKADIARCKHAEYGRGFRALMAHRMGRAAFYSYVNLRGLSYEKAAALRRQRCLTWRWLTLRIHHTLQWLGDGGFDNAKVNNILNDLLDQDYVLLSSFFDGVVSNETDVNTAHADIEWIVGGGAIFGRYGRRRMR
jgi:hypothetical protein